MLGSIPPWLNIGPDLFLNAMRSGAQAGAELRGQDVQQRGQDLAASEAHDRLSLAYAQLQSQEERAAEQAAAKLDLAHATLQAKQEQADLMNQFREKALDLRQKQEGDLATYRTGLAIAQGDKLKLSALRLEDLEKHRKAVEDLMTKAQADREKSQAQNAELRKAALAKKGFHYSPDGSIWQSDATGQLKMIRPPRMSAENSVQDDALKSQQHALATELAQATTPKRRKEVQTQLDDVVKQRKGLRGTTPETPAIDTTPTEEGPPPDESQRILTPSPWAAAAAGGPGSSAFDLTPSTVGQPQAAAPVKRIKVRHPDGSTGTIPEDQADAAKAAGYTLPDETKESDASSND